MARYNGWKNRPTWNANLWLSNDEGLYNAALDICRSAPNFPTAARLLRDFCFEIWTGCVTPDGDSLHDVDWNSVAKGFRE